MSFVPLQLTWKLGDQKNFVARFSFYRTKALFPPKFTEFDKDVWQRCNVSAACQKMVLKFGAEISKMVRHP
jgi:hypothetical protein